MLARLREISKPVSVLSVIGPYRSGKSFLLNLLCEGRTRFPTGATTNPCTQGVWVDIHEGRPDAKEPAVLVMDTEGLFSYNRDETFDSMLFLFTALASSVLLYNSLGVIDERALENFAFLGGLARTFGRRLREQAEDGAQAFEDSVRNLFPHFGWVLRDFTLDLRIGEDGQTLSPDEYLDYALMVRPQLPSRPSDAPGPSKESGVSGQATQKNQIRKAIKECFSDRRCFTLVRPVHDELLLQRIDQAKEDDIREEFLDGLERISGFLTATLRPKRVNDIMMTGEALAGYLEIVADAINAGMLPPIATVVVG